MNKKITKCFYNLFLALAQQNMFILYHFLKNECCLHFTCKQTDFRLAVKKAKTKTHNPLHLYNTHF